MTSSLARGYGGRRYRPWAFTEQGVAMLSSVLRSETAVRVNIEIMRAFVRLRRAAIVSGQVMALISRPMPQYKLVSAAFAERTTRTRCPVDPLTINVLRV